MAVVPRAGPAPDHRTGRASAGRGRWSGGLVPIYSRLHARRGRDWPHKATKARGACSRTSPECDSAVLPLLVSQLSSYNPTRIRAPERLAMRSWRIPSLLRCFFALPVLFALTMATLLTASTSSRADAEPKRVLMLHSFGLRFKPWTDHAQFIREEISRRSRRNFTTTRL